MDKKNGVLAWQRGADINKIASILAGGGVVISSTDTVLGLLATVSERGFLALNRIKERADKPYLVLVGDPQALIGLVEQPLSPGAQRLIANFWPGPLTIIFKAKSSLPAHMKAADGSIAIRMPKHEGLLKLLYQFPQGLFSTSANLAGKPVAKSVADLDPALLAAVSNIIIDEHERAADTPSTIVDCMGDEIRIVREGAIKRNVIESEVNQ